MVSFKRLTGAAFLLLVLAPTYGACTATVGVSEFYSALDGKGLRKRNVFFADTNEIHCVAKYAAARNDYTLNIQFRILQEANGAPTNYLPVVSEAADGPTEDGTFDTKLITLDANGNEDDKLPYTVGRYQCELLVDGKLERTALFNVVPSPCPQEHIPSVTLCTEYPEGLTCPNGFYDGREHSCTCTKTGNGIDLAWVCQ